MRTPKDSRGRWKQIVNTNNRNHTMTTDDDSREITRCTKPPLTAFVVVLLIIIGLALMLGGCVRGYYPNGQKAFEVSGNARVMMFESAGVRMSVEAIDNAIVHRAVAAPWRAAQSGSAARSPRVGQPNT